MKNGKNGGARTTSDLGNITISSVDVDNVNVTITGATGTTVTRPVDEAANFAVNWIILNASATGSVLDVPYLVQQIDSLPHLHDKKTNEKKTNVVTYKRRVVDDKGGKTKERTVATSATDEH